MSKAQQNTVGLPLTLRLIETGLVMVCSILCQIKSISVVFKHDSSRDLFLAQSSVYGCGFLQQRILIAPVPYSVVPSMLHKVSLGIFCFVSCSWKDGSQDVISGPAAVQFRSLNNLFWFK